MPDATPGAPGNGKRKLAATDSPNGDAPPSKQQVGCRAVAGYPAPHLPLVGLHALTGLLLAGDGGLAVVLQPARSGISPHGASTAPEWSSLPSRPWAGPAPLACAELPHKLACCIVPSAARSECHRAQLLTLAVPAAVPPHAGVPARAGARQPASGPPQDGPPPARSERQRASEAARLRAAPARPPAGRKRSAARRAT